MVAGGLRLGSGLPRSIQAADPLTLKGCSGKIRFNQHRNQFTSLGSVDIDQSRNVHFIAEESKDTIVMCANFPGKCKASSDGFKISNSTNVTFTNIRFENCGPLSANVFVSRSSGIVFDGCVFK